MRAINCEHVRAGFFSKGIDKIPGLDRFLGFSKLIRSPGGRDAHDIDVILTWGNKATGRQAIKYAERYGKPIWRLEDGFFRSIHPGPEHPPLSLIIDPDGIYYDAHLPSRLENLLNGKITVGSSDPLKQPDLLERTRLLMQDVRRWGVSKYNYGGTKWHGPGPRRSAKLLLVDQTRNDQSVKGALASDTTFKEMLDTALGRFEPKDIAIKVHPEVIRGSKRGYLSELCGAIPEIQVWSEAVSPYPQLAQTEEVFTVSSQLGFEALIAGKPVTCFGAPFYSGWGLTVDRIPIPRRVTPRTVEQLAAAAWLLYPVYYDQITQQCCEAETVVDLLALQRRCYDENAGSIAVVGFSKWKRPAARAFLGGPHTQLNFVEENEESVSAKTDRVVVWGQRGRSVWGEHCEREKIPLTTIEDGFLRSIELGSDLSLPLSLSLDPLGIYYDPRTVSQLEHHLERDALSEAELARAAQLRRSIIEARLTKYAVQLDRPLQLPFTSKEVILVVGQVEDDASVLLGSPEVKTNEELLHRLRLAHPEAFLLYKPHPDVLSGNRRGALSPDAIQLADHVETTAAITACLDACQTVATMTSLVGFEGLMRGKRVLTFGLPFYAGWGLTTDALSCPRRTRLLSLDELLFATLISYPRYYNYEHQYFISAEQAVAYFLSQPARGTQSIAPTLSRKLKRLARYLLGGLRER